MSEQDDRTGADISDSEAKEFAELWGDNPVHPSLSAYRKMAMDLVTDLLDQEARYSNPARVGGSVPAKGRRLTTV